MIGATKAGGSKGVATLPLQNYLNTLVNLDVFCYSERNEILFRERNNLPP